MEWRNCRKFRRIVCFVEWAICLGTLFIFSLVSFCARFVGPSAVTFAVRISCLHADVCALQLSSRTQLLTLVSDLFKVTQNGIFVNFTWFGEERTVGIFVAAVTFAYPVTYRGSDTSLARPGRKQTRKHVRDARDFNNIETRAVNKSTPRPPPLRKAKRRRKLTPFWQKY